MSPAEERKEATRLLVAFIQQHKEVIQISSLERHICVGKSTLHKAVDGSRELNPDQAIFLAVKLREMHKELNMIMPLVKKVWPV